MVEVSVIIPIYNTEPWLEECLNSVCHQTLNNIEIICVNDGSTDHSLDILKKYAELDERIIVINQENEGLSKARNAGLKCSKGNYVYFLDSDDFIDGDALEILVREMKARDLEMLFFNANVIAEDGVDKHFEQREADYFRRIHEYPPKCKGEDLYRLFWENKEYIVSACMILTDRQFLLRNSVTFPEGIMHEDEVFIYECLLLASKAGYLDRFLYNRRIRPGSLMDLVYTDKLLFSTFSCFICVKLMLRFWYASEFKKENEKSVFSNIERMVIICRNRYGRLKETAKAQLLEMAGKDQYLFGILIQSSFDSNEKIKRLGAEGKRSSETIKRLGEETKRNSEKIRKLETENKALSKLIKDLQRSEKRSEIEKAKLNKRITNLKNSRSYKIGRILTWIPRKIRELVRRTDK